MCSPANLSVVVRLRRAHRTTSNPRPHSLSPLAASLTSSTLRGACPLTSSLNPRSRALQPALCATLRAPRSALVDIKPESVLSSSSTCLQSTSTLLVAFRSKSSSPQCPPSPSSDIRLSQGSAVPSRQPSDHLRTCLARKTTVSTRGLEELWDDPSAPSPLRRACQSPSARPCVPPVLKLRHECFDAPKSLSTPLRQCAFAPVSFACVESPSGLQGTHPITLLTLPIQ
jgi:hypothetical protein